MAAVSLSSCVFVFGIDDGSGTPVQDEHRGSEEEEEEALSEGGRRSEVSQSVTTFT